MIKIPEDMITGTRYTTNNYGELEIVEYRCCDDVGVIFTATGYECSASSERIRSGSVKDYFYPAICGVGFIGVGSHGATDVKVYAVWAHMIKRCYDEKTQLKQPTYIGCSVSPEWHNFQNFAKWYKANYPKDDGDYHLDKDIKIIGNKVYSPETCMFVTQAENNKANAKRYSFLSPDNVEHNIINLSEFCRAKGLSLCHMSAVASGKRPHHRRWTISK